MAKAAAATTAVVVAQPTASAVGAEMSSADQIMLRIIESGSVDALEKFIALRERTEALSAEKDYDLHFSAMQAEFTVVGRSKQGYGYRYCPIEKLQAHYGPTIAKHGFSYRWTELVLENGIKRCTMTISGWGSSRDNSFDIPKLSGTERMNAIQVAGAMSSYGRRYTFISGFGVIIGDEDSDGRVEATSADEEDDELAALLSKAATAKMRPNDIEELRQRYKNVASNPKAKATVLKALHAELDARAVRRGKPTAEPSDVQE